MKKKVKIIRMLWGKRWYSKLIGREIEIKEITSPVSDVYIACENGFPILKVDCELV